MIRSSVVRAFPKPLSNYSSAAVRPAAQANIFRAQLASYARSRTPQLQLSKALAIRKPIATALIRHQSTVGSVDKKYQDELYARKIPSDVEIVSVDSSVRHIRDEVGAEEEEPDVDMMKTIRSDIKTIKDTFSLQDVPKEALYVGLAGVLPYLGTSLATVYLAFDINHFADHGFGFILAPETAEALLHLIEPVQLGYGATIISFLGAIHWGLEWAGFGGTQGYSRYGIGVVATAVAWPTLLLPVEMGLVTQFLAFTLLYFTDARAATMGWAPAWYSTYRFVLTFIVGASIVFSLIGRGQIADKVSKAPGPADRMKALSEGQAAALEREEAERRSRIVDEDEEEEGSEEADE